MRLRDKDRERVFAGSSSIPRSSTVTAITTLERAKEVVLVWSRAHTRSIGERSLATPRNVGIVVIDEISGSPHALLSFQGSFFC